VPIDRGNYRRNENNYLDDVSELLQRTGHGE
jgi:hypothetical protein